MDILDICGQGGHVASRRFAVIIVEANYIGVLDILDMTSSKKIFIFLSFTVKFYIIPKMVILSF